MKSSAQRVRTDVAIITAGGEVRNTCLSSNIKKQNDLYKYILKNILNYGFMMVTSIMATFGNTVTLLRPKTLCPETTVIIKYFVLFQFQ